MKQKKILPYAIGIVVIAIVLLVVLPVVICRSIAIHERQSIRLTGKPCEGIDVELGSIHLLAASRQQQHHGSYR